VTELGELRRVSAWRIALAASAINALGSPLELVFELRLPGGPVFWWPLASAAVGAALALVLVVGRRRTSVRWSSVAFLANAVAINVFLWVVNTRYAVDVPALVPYQPNKLGALIVAVLAPELWVGVLTILLYTGSAVVHHLLLPAALEANALGEPWASAIYGAIALALLCLQLRHRKADWAAIGLQSERAAMEQLAASAMAIRDLANTPLQTVELTTATLSRKHPGLRPEFDRIARALERMRELNAILLQYEFRVAWKNTDESFDPRERLPPAAR
jgi:hypothetical protein